MTKTQNNLTVVWNEIDWRKLEKRVFKLQKRIYRASKRGDVRAVRKLQKTLMRSWSGRCIAVRRVTQDNQGKKTAGVDGIKNLTPLKRLKLVDNLKLTSKARPVRRVMIPKPGSKEQRGLGIPTINDRTVQALVKQALEPEWEAQFEQNSYGFRPGCSCHDAIEAIFGSINQKAKYVLDADIAKCFDRINQMELLKKVDTFPTMRKQIRAWLKAGIMDGNTLFPTQEGTPQGGVISPLLANIALHGLENQISQEFPTMVKQSRETWFHKKGETFRSPNIIRYADDFVVLHEDLKVVQKCQEIISHWLQDMGLELKPSKTHISHTLLEHNGKTGFNFLGFNIRQYPISNKRSGRNNRGEPLGFKTLIMPSRESIKRQVEKVGSIIKAHKSKPQEALIGKLNPIVKGWANYYSTQCSKKTFSKLDHLVYQQLLAWAKYSHPKTALKKVIRKCWKRKGKDNWVFSAKVGEDNFIHLSKYAKTRIIRHKKVKGEASPYDGNLIYWSTRRGAHPECPYRISRLLKEQKGLCKLCKLQFREEDLLEIDHIIPLYQGGKNEHNNLQLLHRHCHDKKTAEDAIRYKMQKETEEFRRYLDENPY